MKMLVLDHSSKIKSLPIAFFIAEILDVFTTFLGLYLFPSYVNEANPFWGDWKLMFFKVLVIISVTIILQILVLPKWFWIVPVVAVLPVFWNIFIIVSTIFYLH
jgi:hypothetical protein